MNVATLKLEGHPAVIYGLPMYRCPYAARGFRTVFVKIHLYNDVVVNAYRYLVYRFSQYAYLKKGVLIGNYDPTTGLMDVELPEELSLSTPDEAEKQVRTLYESFVVEYLLPRLLKLVAESSLDTLLSVFYRRSWEGKATGSASVILLLKHIKGYIDVMISDRSFSIQPQTRRNFEKWKSHIEQEIQRSTLKETDLVVVTKPEKNRPLMIIPLSLDEVRSFLSAMPSLESRSADVKDIKGMVCCYCGAMLNKTRLVFEATGKLGLGRYKLPHEARTDLSSAAQVCPRCVLVSMFYVLDCKENALTYTLNGLTAITKLSRRLNERVTIDVALLITTTIKSFTPPQWASALVLNSAFGEDKINVNVESLDEVAVERLALLSSLFPYEVLSKEGVQRALLGCIRSDFSSFITYLAYILKQYTPKQLEKGGDRMSYISNQIHRYLTPYLYRESDEVRVAYTIAAIAESVVYQLKNKGVEEYTIRKFADSLRTGGLVTAIAYAIPRLGEEIKTLRISDYADKTIVKEILDRYGVQYKDESGALYVYIGSIPPAEMRIIGEYGKKIMLKAYDTLTLLAPVVAVKEGEEETEG